MLVRRGEDRAGVQWRDRLLVGIAENHELDKASAPGAKIGEPVSNDSLRTSMISVGSADDDHQQL